MFTTKDTINSLPSSVIDKVADDGKLQTIDWSQMFNDISNEFKNWWTDDGTDETLTSAQPEWHNSSETVCTDTVLTNTTYFTIFDSTKKAIKCTLLDGKIEDIRCFGLISSQCYPVIITGSNKETWTMNINTPFLNLKFTRDRRWIRC